MGLTAAGMAEIAGLIGDTGSPTAFTFLAYGTDDTVFAVAQTALIAQSQIAAATVSRTTTAQTNDTLQLAKTFSISTTEEIKEVGIFNAATTGDMSHRSVLVTPRSVGSGDSYSLTYKIQVASA